MAQPVAAVQPDMALVDSLGAWPHNWLAVVLIPEIQPVPEGHVRGGSNGVFQCLQLLRALALGLDQYILCFWEAFFIVPDDYPALPEAVFPQADGAFAAFALSSHDCNPSLKMSVRNSSTISAARFCISPVVWV